MLCLIEFATCAVLRFVFAAVPCFEDDEPHALTAAAVRSAETNMHAVLTGRLRARLGITSSDRIREE
jgi:hypothetical protein